MLGQEDTRVHGDAESAMGAGSFICQDCSFPVFFDRPEAAPECPNCGGGRYRRASLFEQPTLDHVTIEPETEAPANWLEQLRASIVEPGRYLALYADGRARLLRLDDGWSRIGRSSSADIRLDDPTVSRRHAVVVCTPEGELRVLDDRSMNGIEVNGEPVDWSPLGDGDTLQIGRYRLHVLDSATETA
jgi:hypothetical protein